MAPPGIARVMHPALWRPGDNGCCDPQAKLAMAADVISPSQSRVVEIDEVIQGAPPIGLGRIRAASVVSGAPQSLAAAPIFAVWNPAQAGHLSCLKNVEEEALPGKS
jgi:hypothetical protein